jgi:hypothetical protein
LPVKAEVITHHAGKWLSEIGGIVFDPHCYVKGIRKVPSQCLQVAYMSRASKNTIVWSEPSRSADEGQETRRG